MSTQKILSRTKCHCVMRIITSGCWLYRTATDTAHKLGWLGSDGSTGAVLRR